MARSYLGKISALVTANTSDFQAKLNASAKDVRAFAGAVQRDIGRASSDATRRLNAIYTPLQRLERALQAASSQRLSFKGFDSAIRTVEDLRKRLQTLSDERSVRLVVEATGLEDINQVRRAVADLSGRSISLLVETGGIERLKQIQRELYATDSRSVNLRLGTVGLQEVKDAIATFNEFSDRQINVVLNAGSLERLKELRAELEKTGKTRVSLPFGNVAKKDLDEIIAKLSRIDGTRLRTVFDVVGADDIERAANAQRQLVSLAESIGRPLEETQRRIASFPALVQGSLLPAFSVLQASLEQLRQDAGSALGINEQAFLELEASAIKAESGVKRVEEALLAVQKLASGQELRFQFPQVSQALSRADAASQAASTLSPSSAIAGGTATLVTQLRSAATAVAAEVARLEARRSFPGESRPVEQAAPAPPPPPPPAQRPTDDQIDKAILGLFARIERIGKERFPGGGRATLSEERAESPDDKALRETIAGRFNLGFLAKEAERAGLSLDEVRKSLTRLEVADKITLRKQDNPLEVTEDDRRLNLTTAVGTPRQLAYIRSGGGNEADFDALGQITRPPPPSPPPPPVTPPDDGEDEARLRLRLEVLNQITSEIDSQVAAENAGIEAEKRRKAAVDQSAQSARRLREAFDFEDSGLVQNFSQAEAEILRIIGLLDKVADEQRDLISAQIPDLIDARDQEDLGRLQIGLRDVRALASEGIRIQVDQDEAQAKVDRLKAQVDALRRDIVFRVTGEFQDAEQGLSRVRELYQEAQKVGEGTLARLSGGFKLALEAAGNFSASGSNEDRDELLRFLRVLGLEIDKDREIKVKTDEAKAKTDALGNSLEALRQNLQFKITGQFQSLDQAREKSIALLNSLSETQLQRFTVEVDSLQAVIATGNLKEIQAAYERIRAATAEGIRLNFGDDLGQGRTLGALAGQVNSVKSQLETLPNAIQARFLPAIKEAEAELERLAASPKATAEAVDAAAARVRRLKGDADRAVAAFNLLSFDELVSSSAARQAEGELQALGRVLVQIGAEAGGPAAAAYERLRKATQDAVAAGTIGLPQVRAQLDALEKEAAQAAAATGRISFDAALQQIKRGGDVARGAFGNAGLAIQQAAFAIDDFFSVTGGLDQRIRAAGNNISQLGFILGGTAGLIAGISVSIGSQLLVALVKWANGGKTTEDQTRSLNEALAEQKRLIDEIAKGFSSLASSIVDGLFSGPAKDAQDFADRVRELADAQRDLARSQILDRDPTASGLRADRNRIQRELENTVDPAERRRLTREADRVDTRLDRIARLRESQARLAGPVNLDRPDFGPGRLPGRRESDETVLLRLIDQLERRLNRPAAPLFDQITGLAQDDSPEVRRQIQAFADRAQIQLRDLQQARVSAGLEDVNRAGAKIRSALSLLEESIGDSPSLVSDSIEELRSGLKAASERLTTAVEGDDRRAFVVATKEIEAINEKIDAALKEAQAVDLARQAVERFAAALDLARQEAQSNLQAAQQAADQARRDDLGRSTPQTQEARARTEADLQRQRELAANVDEEVAAARERFKGDVAETQELRRRAEAAQRVASLTMETYDAAVAAGLRGEQDLGTVGSIARTAREIGNEDLARLAEEAQEAANEAREVLGVDGPGDELWRSVSEAIEAYEAVVNNAADETARSLARVAEIDSLLGTGGVLAPGQREELLRERAQLEAQAVELDEQVRRARDESTAEAERAAAAARGRELSLTEGQRAGANLARGLEDIRQFFGRQAEETTGLVDFEGQRQAQQRFINDSLRSSAPSIFSLADSVQNAIIGGPSRAALEASDVTTVEGQREFNRLMRGDDAARNADFVELQKQSQILQQLLEEAKKQGVVPVVDF